MRENVNIRTESAKSKKAGGLSLRFMEPVVSPLSATGWALEAAELTAIGVDEPLCSWCSGVDMFRVLDRLTSASVL